MLIIAIIIALLVGVLLGTFIVFIFRLSTVGSTKKVLENLKQESEKERNDLLLKAKSEVLEEKHNLDKEMQNRKRELNNLERRLNHKEDNLDKKQTQLERQKQEVYSQIKQVKEKEEDLEAQKGHLQTELEKLAHLSSEEAKAILIKTIEDQAKFDAQVVLNKIESETQRTADKKSRAILVNTMQRVAAELTTDTTVTSLSLPNEEMKGRIIGREGRNIRSLETLTGVDIIIDDTPETAIISCFDPIRRNVAKQVLEKLTTDGRIHPTRIEEIVYQVSKEIQQTIYEEGERVVLELGLQNLQPEIVKGLGRLHFRTSFGQNILSHSKEVSIIGGMIASEIGADVELARRSCLLHDIGKGLETISEKSHAIMGAELANRYGEKQAVVNAIASHHNEVEPETIEAIIVQIADAISAARPGARRESLENYINRLEKLETIVNKFNGVEKSYAIQAGREVRIIINNEKLNDVQMKSLGRDIAKKIESELNFPGRVKLTLIRETRIVEYAK